MSITERMEARMDMWKQDFLNANRNLSSTTQERIFASLNRRENVCTPGFLLRRQLQLKFPKAIDDAAEDSEVKMYANLIESGNLAWDEKLIAQLSKLLSKMSFKRYGDTPLKITSQQWKNWLGDHSHCQRETAIKLMFALDMDAPTATKFLLANDHALLSFRNPFDYVCKVCFDCDLTYANAEYLYRMFDRYCRLFGAAPVDGGTQAVTHDDFTQRIKNETAKIAPDDTITFEEIKKPLVRAMFKYRNDFVERSNEGYSKEALRMFELLLKYLTLLYPSVDLFVGRENRVLVSKAIKTNANGTPKFSQQLVTAMLDSREITLPEYWEVEDYYGPELPERGKEKNIYYNIPFNRDVLIPLKSLAKTIRAILRAINKPENAQAVSRDNLLLLDYFLISGWLEANAKTKTKIRSAIQNDQKGSNDKRLLMHLEDLFDSLDSINTIRGSKVKFFIDGLNLLLGSFDFTGIYLPFVLDRFVLLCLLMDRLDTQYLIQLVIYESYRLSKEMMEEEADENNDGT